MRAALLPAAAAAAAAVLVLTACSDDGAPTPAPANHAPSSSASPSPFASPSAPPSPSPSAAPLLDAEAPALPAAPTPTEEAREELPPELAARMPPEAEIDGLVKEAEAAYLAHRVAYDAAARTGFSDTALVEELVATAAGETLDALRHEIVAISQAGQVVDGGAEITGIELRSLIIPQEDVPEGNGSGLGVVLDVCLHLQGTLQESDGTVVLQLGGEPIHVQARLFDDAGTWLLTAQHVQDGPCPEGLADPAR